MLIHDLGGKGRAGKHGVARHDLFSKLLPRHFAHGEAGVGLEALGSVDDDAVRAEPAAEVLQPLALMLAGDGKDQELASAKGIGVH